jgi:SSS family solute:Na+ symporter
MKIGKKKFSLFLCFCDSFSRVLRMQEMIFQWGSFHIHYLDLGIILTYLLGIFVLGIFIGKGVETGKDFFLAGKTLSWWVVGLSIIGSNIGSNDYMGASGGAYRIGMAQANFEWIGAVPAMILASFVFIPYYWKAGVYSIPEFLGMRYSTSIRLISAVIMCVFNLLISGVFLWSSALMMNGFLGVPISVSIWITAITVGIYTTSGGLKAVAITDSVQVLMMFLGSLLLIYFGLEKLGGWNIFTETLKNNYPNHLSLYLPSDHPHFPWPGVILGLGIVLSPAYWCTSQVILQRSLGAKSIFDSQKSMIFAAFLKTFVPILIVVPGLLALCLAPPLSHSDGALPWLIKNTLPPGISGILFLSFVAALQSSIDSTLNSTATMVSRDIVGILHPHNSDQKELAWGKITTVVSILIAILLAPITEKFEAIFTYVQTILSFFQGPIFALIGFGILSSKPTPTAGLVSLLSGVGISFGLHYMEWNLFYVAFFSFVFSTFVLFAVSLFTTPLSEESLKNVRGEIT